MKLRFERKYLVSNLQLHAIRKQMKAFVEADVHTSLSAHDAIPEYTVRSIYFDTPSLDALYEKEEGLEIRKKLRIRAYNTREQNKGVFFEIKRKYGNKIGKNRAYVPLSDYENILLEGLDDANTSTIPQSHQDDLRRFLFHMHKKKQEPVNLIVYEREAYHGRYDPGIRITFDKNIRSQLHPSRDALFANHDLQPIWPQHFILEIKYYDAPMPSWAKNIVDRFQLQASALSKYAAGVHCHSFSNAALFTI
jgi:hypothetical protein